MAVQPPPIADDHTRLRLEDRLRRLESVSRELRRRARNHPAPLLIHRAIQGFEHELSTVRRELAGLRGGRYQ